MFKIKLFVVSLLLVGSCPVISAGAEPGATCDSDDSGTAASGARPKLERPRLKGAGGLGSRQFERISSLSSLTAEQKTKIDGIISGYRNDIRPLRDQMKTLRQQARNSSVDDRANAEAQTRLAEIRPLIKQKTHDAWDQIKAVLTIEQIKELHVAGSGPNSPAAAPADK